MQKVFTEFGCNIKTRVGLHDVERQRLLAERRGAHRVLRRRERGRRTMMAKLDEVEACHVQKMVFGH